MPHYAVQGTPRENPKTTAAKRWVPWLCAYSGARVAEMIQLRKQDVRRDKVGGLSASHRKREASRRTIYRDVPVHEHLIAVGFVELVQDAKDGTALLRRGR